MNPGPQSVWFQVQTVTTSRRRAYWHWAVLNGDNHYSCSSGLLLLCRYSIYGHLALYSRAGLRDRCLLEYLVGSLEALSNITECFDHFLQTKPSGQSHLHQHNRFTLDTSMYGMRRPSLVAAWKQSTLLRIQSML